LTIAPTPKAPVKQTLLYHSKLVPFNS
jgi:hypothetical protein